jgi:Tol biopolymer transport system component
VLFSPDGKYLAYDLPTDGNAGAKRDIYVISATGASKTVAVAHPANDLVVGWSPAGDELLFNSDRSGSMGLWMQPMTDGKPRGPASLVKPDLFADGMGLTRTGTLVYGTQTSAIKVFTASVDFATGKLSSSPTEVGETYVTNHRQPAWTADGQYLVFNR